MDLHLQKTRDMMRNMVQFAIKEISPFIESMEQGEFPREILKKMGDLGLMGIPVPKKYGGAGMDFISYIIAIHELSKISATVGVILSVHTSVGTNPIIYFGTEEQKQDLSQNSQGGQYLGAFCLPKRKPDRMLQYKNKSGSKTGDHYIINGSKLFITNGGDADLYIVFAVT